MRQPLLILLLLGLTVWGSSCNQHHGCTEATADNYDPEAENDDGTCIPARDKMIGNYTYTRIWVDPATETDTLDMGTFQVTEANTAGNAFNMFISGNLIVQGAISANSVAIKQFAHTDTFFGLSFEQPFTGGGSWLVSDSVDLTFSLNTQFPIDVQGDPPTLVTVPLTYNYYCTKTD